MPSQQQQQQQLYIGKGRRGESSGMRSGGAGLSAMLLVGLLSCCCLLVLCGGRLFVCCPVPPPSASSSIVMLRLSTESLSSLLLSLSLATGHACWPLGTLDHHHHHQSCTLTAPWTGGLAGWRGCPMDGWMDDGWISVRGPALPASCPPYSLSSLESPVSPAPKSSCRLSPSVPSIRLVLRSASAR